MVSSIQWHMYFKLLNIIIFLGLYTLSFYDINMDVVCLFIFFFSDYEFMLIHILYQLKWHSSFNDKKVIIVWGMMREGNTVERKTPISDGYCCCVSRWEQEPKDKWAEPEAQQPGGPGLVDNGGGSQGKDVTY